MKEYNGVSSGLEVIRLNLEVEDLGRDPRWDLLMCDLVILGFLESLKVRRCLKRMHLYSCLGWWTSSCILIMLPYKSWTPPSLEVARSPLRKLGVARLRDLADMGPLYHRNIRKYNPRYSMHDMRIRWYLFPSTTCCPSRWRLARYWCGLVKTLPPHNRSIPCNFLRMHAAANQEEQTWGESEIVVCVARVRP